MEKLADIPGLSLYVADLMLRQVRARRPSAAGASDIYTNYEEVVLGGQPADFEGEPL